MTNFNLKQKREECCWIWELEFTGKTPKSQEEAWAITLEKWETIAAKYPLHVIDGGEKTCGLCMLYRRKDSCSGCPVQQHTGLPHCKGTPYQDFLILQAKPEELYQFFVGVQAAALDTVSEA